MRGYQADPVDRRYHLAMVPLHRNGMVSVIALVVLRRGIYSVLPHISRSITYEPLNSGFSLMPFFA